MAKGKYKTRKQNRDASQLAEDLAVSRAQLAEEETRLAAMRERADLDARLRADLTAAVAARDAVCGPQLERIAADRDAIRAATRELRELADELSRHMDKVTDWAWDAFGPERLYALLSGNRVFLREGVEAKQLSSEAAEAIQRARGIRKDAPLDFSAAQKMALAGATASATGVPLPDDVTEIDSPAWDAYAARVQKDSAAAIAFKAPPPWLDVTPDEEHLVTRILGACPPQAAVSVDPPKVVPAVTELSTGSAAMRESATAAGATAVADAFIGGLQRNITRAANSQIPSPVADSSPYPAPADAAALQSWYALSAIGAWGRHRTTANGRIAVAAAAAVPFWLPPGHTIAYLDSEPLTGEDMEDMRLPFAQVLVTFAEPAGLPAVDASVLADDPRMREIDHLVGITKGLPGTKDMMITGTNNFRSALPTLWDAIAARGAHVEGVLLLADASGRIDDLFGWCLAIPSNAAGAALGRWVIPASRSATSYANLIANAAAVAAWADWHRPGHDRTGDEQDTASTTTGADGSRQQTRPADTVHVLNVTATTPVDPLPTAKGEPTGRTTAPHARRGHWRRQHFGPGRTQTRRVRIAPVMVNAGRVGAGRPQIYRLPTPKLSESASPNS